MSALIKNIFVIVVCIAVAAVAYYVIFSTDGTDAVSDSSTVRQELLDKTQSFIERSAKLQQVNIDQSFFTDSTFTSLRSFSTAVPDQPLGRDDIFDSASSITNPAAAVGAGE